MKADAELKKDVRTIALALDVTIGPQRERSDTEIAAAVEKALRWSAFVPVDDKVRVTVEKGWVTLQGELGWDFQRQAAVSAVRPLRGVLGVFDEITLKPGPKLSQSNHRSGRHT